MTVPETAVPADLLDGYGSRPLDEAVDPAGEVRLPYREVFGALCRPGRRRTAGPDRPAAGDPR